MKIERINENQIRCTLTREDLISRQIKLSELAYGSDKAKALFKELMEQASYQYGFEADDIPLMIEAIPLSSESIVLLVTKVEDPDELDTRFSRFSDDEDEYDDDDEDFSTTSSSKLFNDTAADDVLNIFNGMLEKVKDALATPSGKKSKNEPPVDITKLFVFETLDEIISLSTLLATFYSGKNSLYKSPSTGLYYLVISKSNDTPETYNKVCNILAEYGNQNNYVIGTDNYMSEHYTTIVANNAIQQLATIS